MNISLSIQTQLLATKLFVPVTSGIVVSRHRLSSLLYQIFKYPLALISAPAGFGKTTLLSTWIQSLPANDPLVAWVSLEEDDNDPRLFWTYILSALDQQKPEHFTPLLKYLQSPQAPPLEDVLTMLSNLMLESTEHFVLVLDDYHLITEQQVHVTLSYLVEHPSPQLHIILATRTDPPLPLSLLRIRGQLLEIRTDHLRCTAKETGAFFQEVMGLQLSKAIVQEITARMEGWLVGLQLLGLSLPERVNPTTLLQEISGDQRYILDYLTEEVLRRQPSEVQTFLLSTCILEQLNASLCDAVMQRTGSQQMLERLERANLFVMALDSKRQWYRYHALFAEALRYRLEQTHGDLMLRLHHRASLWYAEHNQTTQAILHAFSAHQWSWAADLIEQKSFALNALTWGISKQKLAQLRDWLEQIPVDIVRSRPRLCLACTWMLLFVAPQTVVEGWLNAAETTLTAELMTHSYEESLPPMRIPQARQERENMLGEAITYRALMRSFHEDVEATLALCQQAQALLSADNFGARAHIAVIRLITSYISSVNDAVAAVQIGLQAASSNQAAGNIGQTIGLIGLTVMHMITTGQLHETQRLTQQAILLGSKPGAFVSPAVGWPMIWQAEVLREWNELEAALSCVEEAIRLCEQVESTLSPIFSHCGYMILLRICLSRRDYNAARSAFQEFERTGRSMSRPWYNFHRSHFTVVDQVRLWLACGELDRATRWAETLNLGEPHSTAFAHEREEVACVRILLAKKQFALALQRLEPVLQRATKAQRWGHVIEMRLLQALAYQMCHEEEQALSALSEAVRLAEPEGYVRSFVDEGVPMAALLSRLREECRKQGPTSYLDTLLAAFLHQSNARKRQSKRTEGHTPRPKY